MKKTLVIFEIANNHMGDFNYAKKIIDSFFKLKKKFSKDVDFAFKFQFRDLETFINHDYKHFNIKSVNRFESTKFSLSEWSKIINYTKKKI